MHYIYRKAHNMVYGLIDRKQKHYTFLGNVFKAINNRQNNYNWLVCRAECYPQNKVFEEMFDRDYCWLSGEELTAIIAQEDFQWVWAVLSGFEKDVTLDEVLSHPLPSADYEGFWQLPLSIQHPLATVEIVPFDSSYTLVLSKDEQLISDYHSVFPKSEDLIRFNSKTSRRHFVNTYILSCLDSIDWSKCEAQPISQCRWSPNPAPAATVQGLYLKDRALVFRLVSHAAPTRAVNTEPDSAVWEDSCLECFFSFDGKNYVNLEANVNSALRASFGPDRHNRKFLKEMDVPMPAVQAKELKEGWDLVLSIPLELVEKLWGVKACSGTWFRANFYSCGDATPLPHYASWNPVETKSPDFHRPEYFGNVIIE